jgi:hypothetical protein
MDRILDRVGVFAVLLLLGALAHAGALSTPVPLMDERVFVGASHRVVAGRSAYEHPVYNYPPPLAHAGAALIEMASERLLLMVARGANLAAGSALIWYAAGFAGVGRRGRFLLAAAMVVFLPGFREAIAWGNLVPIAAALALAAWSVGARRPGLAALLLGASLALKPIALVGAVAGAAVRARSRAGLAGRVFEVLAGPTFAALLVAPWWRELDDLARRMLQPPIFSTRNLSLRRALEGLGLDVPAWALALAALLAALLAVRSRRLDHLAAVHLPAVASVVALPVVWSHAFLLLLPLQVEAAARWWRRRRARREAQGAAALGEWWGVPLALAAVQGAAAAGVEFAAPRWVHAFVVAAPMAAVVGLLAYLAATTEKAGADR